jgi:hypothetical protein
MLNWFKKVATSVFQNFNFDLRFLWFVLVFTCIFFSYYTEPLQTVTDGEEIGNALSALPFFDGSESVSVTATTLSSGAPGAVLTVTFTSERGKKCTLC